MSAPAYPLVFKPTASQKRNWVRLISALGLKKQDRSGPPIFGVSPTAAGSAEPSACMGANWIRATRPPLSQPPSTLFCADSTSKTPTCTKSSKSVLRGNNRERKRANGTRQEPAPPRRASVRRVHFYDQCLISRRAATMEKGARMWTDRMGRSQCLIRPNRSLGRSETRGTATTEKGAGMWADLVGSLWQPLRPNLSSGGW